MIPLSVSEISALDGFCDEEQQHEEELDFLVVGCTHTCTQASSLAEDLNMNNTI